MPADEWCPLSEAGTHAVVALDLRNFPEEPGTYEAPMACLICGKRYTGLFRNHLDTSPLDKLMRENLDTIARVNEGHNDDSTRYLLKMEKHFRQVLAKQQQQKESEL